METSPEIGEVAAALAKAQGAVKGAVKDVANEAFKRNGKASTYADLASVWDACREALSANGIAIVQSPGETANGVISLSTLLMHSSGQWIKDTLTIPLSKVDAQGYGSATTYARRYALSAFVGVAPEDDDGNAAVSSGSRDGATNDKPAQARRPKLTGHHKTWDALRTATGELKKAILEAADGGDPMYLDEVLVTHADTVQQLEAEGGDWWSHDDYGIQHEIAKAKDRLNG